MIDQGLSVPLLRALYTDIGASLPNDVNLQSDDACVCQTKEEDTAISGQTHSAHRPFPHTFNKSPHASESPPIASLDSLALQRRSADVENSAPIAPVNADIVQAKLTRGSRKIIESGGWWQADKGHAMMDENKVVNRAEYIARMMAAKSGKSIAGTSITQGNTMSDQSRAKGTDMAERTSATSPKKARIPIEVTDTQSLPRSTVSSSGKMGNVQTEIARWRIEALKNRQWPQRKHSPDKKQELPSDCKTPRLHCEVTDTTLHVDMGHNMPDSQPSPHPPASYFSPVSVSTAINIPGLFTRSIGEVKNSTVAADGESFADRSNTKGPPTSPLVHLDNAQGCTVSLSQDRQEAINSSIEQSHQRSIAADFVRQPPARLQMSMSQLQDASVIIDISEGDETDDDSNALDDGGFQPTDAPSSGAPHDLNSHFMDTSVRHQNTNQEAAHGNIGMLHDTLPTIDRTPEPHNLKIKEFEIRSMNRKIAELEQRIQAKRKTGQSQGQGTLVTNSSKPVTIVDEKSRDALLSSSTALGSATYTQASDTATEQQTLEEKQTQEYRSANVAIHEIRSVDNKAVSSQSDNHQDQAGQQVQTHKEEASALALLLGTDRSQEEDADLHEKHAGLTTSHKHDNLESEASPLVDKIGELEAKLRLNKSEHDRIKADLRNAYARKESYLHNISTLTELQDAPRKLQVHAEESRKTPSKSEYAMTFKMTDSANSPTVPADMQNPSGKGITSLSVGQSGLFHKKSAACDASPTPQLPSESMEKATSLNQGNAQTIEGMQSTSGFQENVRVSPDNCPTAETSRIVAKLQPRTLDHEGGYCKDDNVLERPSQSDFDRSPVIRERSGTDLRTSHGGHAKSVAGNTGIAISSTAADAMGPQTVRAPPLQYADEAIPTPCQRPKLPLRSEGDESDDYEPPEPGLFSDKGARCPGQTTSDDDNYRLHKSLADASTYTMFKVPENPTNHLKVGLEFVRI